MLLDVALKQETEGIFFIFGGREFQYFGTMYVACLFLHRCAHEFSVSLIVTCHHLVINMSFCTVIIVISFSPRAPLVFPLCPFILMDDNGIDFSQIKKEVSGEARTHDEIFCGALRCSLSH